MRSFVGILVALAYLLFAIGGCSPSIAKQDPDSLNSMMLDIAALAAFENKDFEEAGVLFLKSKVRFQVDRVVFPPVGKGDSSPAVLKSAMAAMLGSTIMKEINTRPKIFLNVVRRLEKWEPKFPTDYDPGWKYRAKIADDQTATTVAKIRNRMLPSLRKKATLLANKDYQQVLVDLGKLRRDNVSRHRELEDSRQVLKAAGKKTDSIDREIAKLLGSQRSSELKLQRAQYEIEWKLIPESRFHRKVGWVAENYFSDPDVIQLCHAIEEDDLQRIRKLIDEGVNVNALGKTT